MYVANNYEDRKVRLVRWQGIIICANCRYKVIPHIKSLIEGGVLRITKAHIERLASKE